MRLKSLVLVTLIVAPFIMLAANAGAEEFSGKFSGFEEVGPLPGPANAETGAIFSPGTATVSLDLNRSARTITFKLMDANPLYAVISTY